MPTFTYKVRSAEGKVESGTMVAANQTDALTKVRKLGGVPLAVEEMAVKRGFSLSFGGGKISLKDRIVLTEQLSVMIKAGITLVQALRGLAEESSNKTLSTLLFALIADVEAGIPFSNALEKHPRVFSSIFCQMVRSSEKTGNLADVLAKLTIQQQKEYDLKGKIKGALMYPVIISILMVGVIILVITFILPKLTGLFTESGAALPLSTRFLLALSAFMTQDWYILIIAVVGLYFGCKYLLKIPKVRFFWDGFKMKMPVLGSFMKKSYMARFTQSFASLAQAGVPVLEIFKTLNGIVGNTVYEAEIAKVAKDVENGIKVSVAIRKSPYFPAMVGQLVSVGEQSGDLAGVFEVLGNFFEKEVDSMAKNLSTLLEPIIMVVMGAGIGFILISVLQPIYGLVNAI